MQEKKSKCLELVTVWRHRWGGGGSRPSLQKNRLHVSVCLSVQLYDFETAVMTFELSVLWRHSSTR